MIIYTIGFTKKSADRFFELLRFTKARHLLDIRLNNNSQLAGFTKRNDLAYFLKHLVDIEYHEVPVFAPDKSILKEYRKTGDWDKYERSYLKLVRQRKAEKYINPTHLEEGIVLLCSEAEPTNCHRRLAAEYLVEALPVETKIEIIHL